MNVLDLRGPEFLRFYIVIFALAVGLAMLLRFILRQPGGDIPSSQLPTLHPLEVAYLAGAGRGIIDAVIATLVQRGHLVVDKVQRRLTVGPAPQGLTPLEEAVYHAVKGCDGKVSGVRRAVADMTRSATSRLQALGLVLTDSQSRRVRLLPSLLVLGVTLLGVAKILVGIDRHRPVSFLVTLTVLSMIVAITFVARPAIRTRRGSAVLERLKAHNAALRTTASHAPNLLVGNDLALAFALFGAGAFASGPMADLRQTLAPPSQGGSGCGGGSSCGGGSCGGGGCGGGGCGGCGGGGD
jgi:uncharacterized protein (TIGR04222 family)